MGKELDGETLAWRRRKDHRPQEILSAARQLVEEEGAAATSMARIAKLAGVSEATVYKYYESKQDLINQVLAEWALPFVSRLDQELQYVKGLRPQLSLIADRFLRSMEETPKFHRVFYQELRWSDYKGSELHRINHTFAQTVVTAVQRAIADGEVRSNLNPIIIRDMLFGGLEHIALRTSFIGKKIDIDKEVTSYIDILMSGISIPKQENPNQDDLGRLATLVDRMEKLLPGEPSPSVPQQAVGKT